MDNIKVCCSSCGWQPEGKKLWLCNCGNRFDAFQTLGTCNCCGKEWEYIQCVEEHGGCNAAAPIDKWFQGLDQTIITLLNEMDLKRDPSTI
jgi:hypothetical protein